MTAWLGLSLLVLCWLLALPVALGVGVLALQVLGFRRTAVAAPVPARGDGEAQALRVESPTGRKSARYRRLHW